MIPTKLQYTAKSNARIFAKCFGRVMLLIICVLSILLIGFYSRHSYFSIYGASMEPQIASKGYSCFINKSSPYSYGDIVVAYDKTVHSTPVIKRVIATGGDMLGFYYNSSPQNSAYTQGYYQILLIKAANPTEVILLDEPYLIHGITNPQQQNQLLANTVITYQKFLKSPQLAPKLSSIFMLGQFIQLLNIEENQVFLLGDNRKVSLDSATYGAVPASSIQGKVEYIFENTVSTFEIALKDIFGL